MKKIICIMIILLGFSFDAKSQLEEQKITNTYNMYFIYSFGQIHPDQSWGFKKIRKVTRVLVEDLSAQDNSDFDFNDLVFDVEFESVNKAKITIQAVGTTLPIEVAGKEAHKAMGYSRETLINTSGKNKINPVSFVAEGDFGGNPKNIPVKVQRGDIWVTTRAMMGEPPSKIAVSGDFVWCNERTVVTNNYNLFNDWVKGGVRFYNDTDENFYKLNYIINDSNISSYEVEFGAVTPIEAPEREGYTFSGWSELPSTMPAKDVTVTGSFTINKYKLTYKVDGEVYKEYDVEYGATITPETAPTKEGYTFSGWSEIPSTMPANDVTVTGSFTINKYKLIYKVDGEVYKEFDVEYGATITPETAPTKEGYTFSGWSDIPETMPAHDVTITGSFTQIKKADPDLAINSNEHWVNPFGFYVTIGQTYNSPKLINPHGLSPITWTSSHPEVATVGDNGVLTLQSAGSTQIKATFAGNNEYNAGYAEYSLIVLDGYKVTSEGTVTLTGGNQTGEVTIETTVNINGQTYKVTAIGENAFNGNTQITTVTIPDGISVIGANAFSGCINLLVINIGKSVSSIGNKAFANVGTYSSARTRGESAFTVNCYAESVPQTASDAFENSPIATGTLLVNDNIVDAYKTTSPWSQFGKIQGFQEAAGIGSIIIDNPNAHIYDMQGNRIDNLQKGVNIIRLEDGKTKKVIVK